MLVHDTVWTSLHTFLAQLVEHQPSKLVCIGSSPIECAFFWSSKEAWGGIEPPFKDLQSFALPLDDQALEKLVSSQGVDSSQEIFSQFVVLYAFHDAHALQTACTPYGVHALLETLFRDSNVQKLCIGGWVTGLEPVFSESQSNTLTTKLYPPKHVPLCRNKRKGKSFFVRKRTVFMFLL